MTPSIDQTLNQFANLLPILTLLPNFGGFHRTLQRVRLANRGRLLLRTPCPVPFGTCICSNVETILSWTRHIYGLFEFRTSLGTSILPFNFFLPLQFLEKIICIFVLADFAHFCKFALTYTHTIWCLLNVFEDIHQYAISLPCFSRILSSLYTP